MVMPFSTKETGLSPEEGPTHVDFDSLWEKALGPAIEANGYTAVRADQDAGALIIVEMIERLAMSDLVVADISIGNANVYYEIGVRHAAQQYGCVLTSASWARVLFDIDQMPRVVYDMAEGGISDSTAATIRQQVEDGIRGLKEGESPVWQAIPGYPTAAQDDDRVSRFKADAEEVNSLLGRLRAVRRTIDLDERKAAALALRDELAAQPAMRDGVRLEMMDLLRDCAGWDEALAWIETMPERLRTRPSIQEQRLLALSKSGDPEKAIGALEQLIEAAGDTSERRGLLGGRYKKLYYGETDERKRRIYLNRAIDQYERGVLLDLNDYYPSCNLPRLYRERAQPGDDDKARVAGGIALKACERSRRLNPDDPWLRPTLLGAAFDARNTSEAQRLAGEVENDSPASWKLQTTIADLRTSTEQASGPERGELAAVFNRLNDMLPDGERSEPLAVDAPPAPALPPPVQPLVAAPPPAPVAAAQPAAAEPEKAGKKKKKKKKKEKKKKKKK